MPLYTHSKMITQITDKIKAIDNDTQQTWLVIIVNTE